MRLTVIRTSKWLFLIIINEINKVNSYEDVHISISSIIDSCDYDDEQNLPSSLKAVGVYENINSSTYSSITIESIYTEKDIENSLDTILMLVDNSDLKANYTEIFENLANYEECMQKFVLFNKIIFNEIEKLDPKNSYELLSNKVI